MLNSVIAVMKIGRVWKRCSRKPVIGMTTAMVSMNAVVSHWAADAEMCEIAHEVGDRDAHDRLVQDDDEGRDQQQRDDEAVACAQRRCLVGGALFRSRKGNWGGFSHDYSGREGAGEEGCVCEGSEDPLAKRACEQSGLFHRHLKPLSGEFSGCLCHMAKDARRPQTPPQADRRPAPTHYSRGVTLSTRRLIHSWNGAGNEDPRRTITSGK